MMAAILARVAVLAVVGALAATLLTGCGGGGTDPQGASSCTLGSTAGCGGSGVPTPPSTPSTPPVVVPVPPVIDPATVPAALNLVFSAPELPTSGATPVTVTAIVKNASNAALPSTAVTFAADSGLLSLGQANTDAQGQAKVTLSTGGSRANRTITITAKSGTLSASAQVPASGTTLTLSGPLLLGTGAGAEVALSLKDSAGLAIGGASVTFSTRNGNPLTVKNGAAPVTDAQGQLLLHLQGATAGAEQVSVSALGAAATRDIVIASAELVISPAIGTDASGAELLTQGAVGSCQPVDVSYVRNGSGQSGLVTLSTTLGQVYADGACLRVLSGPLPLSAGKLPRTFVRSASAGIATIAANVSGGPGAQTRIEFVAPLTATATVSLQAAPATLRSQPGGQPAFRSTLTAVVRDGTAANNLVKNASVVFSLLSDPSGGSLLLPVTVVTGSDGAAQAVYLGGPADSGRDGVLVQARVLDLNGVGVHASATSHLTVSKQALSIQVGTGNKLTEYSDSVLQQEFSVLVSDAAGNAVPGVQVTAAAWATRYRKGNYIWQKGDVATGTPGIWVPAIGATCQNEDRLRTGIYDSAYDLNHNGTLEPGLPVTVTSSGVTDALGLATLRLNYPRDRGNWLEIELTVRGTVSGTESGAVLTSWLGALGKDLTDIAVTPPGMTSPYGTGSCSISN